MPAPSKAVDQPARDEIAKIGAHLEAHEKVCAEIRQQEAIWRAETRTMLGEAIKELKDSNVRLGESLKSSLEAHAAHDERVIQDQDGKMISYIKPLYSRFWSLLIGLCVGLFGVIGFLAPRALHLG